MARISEGKLALEAFEALRRSQGLQTAFARSESLRLAQLALADAEGENDAGGVSPIKAMGAQLAGAGYEMAALAWSEKHKRELSGLALTPAENAKGRLSDAQELCQALEEKMRMPAPPEFRERCIGLFSGLCEGRQGAAAFFESCAEGLLHLSYQTGHSVYEEASKHMVLELLMRKSGCGRWLFCAPAQINERIRSALSEGLAAGSEPPGWLGESLGGMDFFSYLSGLNFAAASQGVSWAGLRGAVWFLSAAKLCYGQGDCREEFELGMQCFLSKKLFFCESLLTEAGEGRPQEWAIRFSDSVEGIYKSLGKVAEASKSGGAIAAHLSGIRAAGSKISGGRGASNGLVPVLELLDCASRMLSPPGDEELKVRVFVDAWHPDVLAALEFFKKAGKNLRLSVGLTDGFMKKASRGENWRFCDPALCSKASRLSGEELDAFLDSHPSPGQSMKAGALLRLIAEVAGQAGTPSVHFPEAAAGPFKQDGVCLMGPRMSSFLQCPMDDELYGQAECCVCLDGLDPEQGAMLLELAGRIISRVCAGIRAQARSVTPGISLCGEQTEPAGLCQALQLCAGPDSWESPDARAARLRKERDGHALAEKLGFSSSARGMGWPALARSLCISSREEFLWFMGKPPVFLEAGSFKVWPRFKTAKPPKAEKKAPFKTNAGVLPLLPKVSLWQSAVGQAVCWDAMASGADPETLSLAIRKAWLSGLCGIRRI